MGQVFHVRYDDRNGQWILKGPRGIWPLGRYESIAEALVEARRLIAKVERGGHTARVVVHRRQGGIELEWTYGDDRVNASGFPETATD